MAKIHKSSMVFLDSNKPIILDLPFGFPGLRERVIHQVSENSWLGVDEESMAGLDIDSLMMRARAGAATLLGQARAEADIQRTLAVEEGYREGLKRAEAECGAMVRDLENEHGIAMSELQKRFENEIDAMEPEVLDLALSVAGKILKLELSRNDNAFAGLVHKAMALLKTGERGVIRVGREDFFRSVQADDSLRAETLDIFEFVVDESLPSGGCVIESPSGILEAGADVQLENIAQALRVHGE